MSYLSNKSRLLLVFSVLMCATLSMSCGNNPVKPDCKDCCEIKPANSESIVPVSNHLIIYIDISESMSGFVNDPKTPNQSISEDMQTIFSKSLIELRNSAKSLNSENKIVVKEVTSTVSVPSLDDFAITNAALQKKIYKGSETNLASAVQDFSVPVNENQNSNPATLHILVTDSIQSTKADDPKTGCAAGSDWNCVRNKMKELIGKGWGGTILGIKSEFNGSIFSEMNKTKVPYSTGRDVKKFKPFYLFVFSPNPKTHNELINLLKKKLNQITTENKLDRKEIFREFPLTPELISGAVQSEFEITKKSDLLEVKQPDKDKSEFDVFVDTKTESKGNESFSIKLKIPWTEQTMDVENPAESKNLIVWKLEKIPTEENEKYRYPDLVMSKDPIITGNEISFDFEAGWKLGIGGKGWRRYQLVGKIDSDKMPSWIKSWSTDTDTTADKGNKTLNLESSLSTLWNNKAVTDYTVAKVCFTVGDK